MSEISSGLVAVAWIAPDEDRFRVRICEDRPTDAPLWSPMCWVSDAEAIIAQKDAEILEQCRINGMGAEREATLLGKVERQSAALKLAREALFDMQDSYAAVHGWKDSFVIAATTAIAAIDSLQKGGKWKLNEQTQTELKCLAESLATKSGISRATFASGADCARTDTG